MTLSHVTHYGRAPSYVARASRPTFFSRATFLSHVTLAESSRTWMSHGTYEWDTARMHESCHVWPSHVAREWVMSHASTSHVTHVAEFCHTSRRVILHILPSHVTCAVTIPKPKPEILNPKPNDALDMRKRVQHSWVLSRMVESCRTWMIHVTHRFERSTLTPTTRWTWMGHVTYQQVTAHVNESWHTWMSYVAYEWVMSHIGGKILLWRQWRAGHAKESSCWCR